MSALAPTSPEELLFTDHLGVRRQLEDVIDSGLEADYSQRMPALRALLEQGTPQERLYACMMLVAWGDLAGYDTLLRWADEPARLPWRLDSGTEPASLDRFFGADDSFSRLTGAVNTSCLLSEGRPALMALQEAAVRALLRIYADEYFARELGDLLNTTRALGKACLQEIDQALAACLARLGTVDFDLHSQMSFLLAPFARYEDVKAAQYAELLLAQCPPEHRAMSETAHALRMGTGDATTAVLEKLLLSNSARVRQDAEVSLQLRRKQRPPGS